MKIISELRSRMWAMERTALENFMRQLDELQMSLDDAPEAARGAVDKRKRPKPNYEVDEDGTATILIQGLILKSVPAFLGWFGIAATSTKQIERALEEALADGSVRAIDFLVDSPGGTVDGVQELADAIFEARGQKPMLTRIEDLCASAAYWIASQADVMLANRTAAVGSIGVYAVLDDWSGAYEKVGIKTHVIRSGKYKGTGVSGAPITDEELAPIQEEIDDIANEFIDAVARGRGVPREAVADFATGQVWIGRKAVGLGLIDGVAGATGSGGTGKDTHNLGESKTEEGESTMADLTEDEKRECAIAFVKGLSPDAFAEVFPEAHKAIEEKGAAQGEERAAETFKARVDEVKEITGDDASAALTALIEGTSADDLRENVAAQRVTELTTLREENAKLKAELEDGAPPVADAPPADSGAVSGPEAQEERWKAEFAASEDLQKEFAGSESVYVHYKRSEQRKKDNE